MAVAVGDGDGLGVKVGVGDGDGDGVEVGVGVAVDARVGVGVAVAVGDAVGDAVGSGSGVADTTAESAATTGVGETVSAPPLRHDVASTKPSIRSESDHLPRRGIVTRRTNVTLCVQRRLWRRALDETARTESPSSRRYTARWHASPLARRGGVRRFEQPRTPRTRGA